MTQRCALFGADVSRSRSPGLHRAAAEALGVDLTYEAVSVPDEPSFRTAFRHWRQAGGTGANVTAPYKAKAAGWCDRLDPLARELGVVNTLTVTDSGLEGSNTDAPGLVTALGRIPGLDLSSVQIVGAGGAARAAVWAVRRLGAKTITVGARDLARARRLALRFPGTRAAPWGPVSPVTAVLVAIPPAAGLELLDGGVDWSQAPTLVDLAYGPEGGTTELVAEARRAGHRAEDGWAMLQEQAALAFARWTGRPLQAVRAAMGAAARSF